MSLLLILGLRFFEYFGLLLLLCPTLNTVRANVVNARHAQNFQVEPRILPRSELISLPIVARGVAGEIGGVNGTGPANLTTAAGMKASAVGLAAIAQAEDRQSYYALIQVGNIYFRVVLDTGSSDLWLISSACETDSCKSLPKYPLSYQSSTFQEVNGNMTVFRSSYADGSAVSGFVAREKVQLDQIAVSNQAIGLITDSNVTMSDQESGILGLGFPRLSSISNALVANSTPFFASLAQQGLVRYPLFGISLANNSTGSLSLGAIDASIVTNPNNISWNNVAEFSPFGTENNASSYLHWAIPLSSFAVNGTQMTPLPTYTNATHNVSLALFDIGTPGIYGPYQDVTRIYSLIEGARLVDSSIGQWALPCDTTIPLSFTFGQHEYVLHPSNYIIGSVSENPNLCLSWLRAVPPSSDGIDWQIGSTFLQTVYTIFSYGIDTKEPPKIGLYPLNALNSTNNGNNITQQTSTVLSAFTTVITTTLPNSLVPTPSFTIPPYTFNTSVPATIGGIVSTELATSTYNALLGQSTFNASAIPTISPPPAFTTLTLTDMNGAVKTSVSSYTTSAVTLGVPSGWNAATSVRMGAGTSFPSLGLLFILQGLVILWTSVFTMYSGL